MPQPHEIIQFVIIQPKIVSEPVENDVNPNVIDITAKQYQYYWKISKRNINRIHMCKKLAFEN